MKNQTHTPSLTVVDTKRQISSFVAENAMNSNIKSTPGPWIWNDGSADIWPTHGRRAPIAQVFTAKNPASELSTESGLLTEEETANARLIAASPLLYAFVAKLADSGNQEAKQMLDSLQINDIASGLSAMGRAAIAAAQGEGAA